MLTRRTVRTVAAGLGCTGLALVAAGTPASGGAPADFIDGSGTARAQLARIAPRTGGLTYAVTTGVALAGYEGQVGRSQAQAVDFGLFGLVLTTVGPCGGEPLLRPDQLPKPVRAHSVNGPPDANHTYAGGPGAGLGSESAWAGPATEARAESAAAVLEVPGVVRATGGTSRAASRLVAGQAREATASVSLGSVSLAGGAVELRGLHWDVTEHSGVAPLSTGSFRLGDVLVGGAPLPGAATADPSQALAQVASVLAPFGMTLTPPAVVRHEGGEVEVTPLRFTAGGKTQISEPVGGLLGAAQPARDVLATVGEGDPNDCSDPRAAGVGPLANAGVLLADITLAGFTGTGGIDVEFGGVRAATEGVAYDSPFGARRPFPGPVALPAPVRVAVPAEPAEVEAAPDIPAPAGPAANPPSAVPTGNDSAPRVPAEGISPAPEPAPRPEFAAVPVSETRQEACASTHPLRRTTCSEGAGMVAGAASLLVAGALFAGDALLARRRPDQNGAPA